MIHIIKQAIFLYDALIFSKLTPESSNLGVSEELTEENKEKYLNENKDKIVSYINSLDFNADTRLSFSDLEGLDNDGMSLGIILRALKIDTYKLSEGISISDIVEKINSYSLEKTGVIEDTKSEEKILLKEVETNSSFNDKLSSMNSLDISTVKAHLDREINSSSFGFDRKGAQISLQKLGYDISFVNKNGVKVTGEAAIDGKLGSSFTNAVKNLQKDLGISQTGNLDKNTIDSLQSSISNFIIKNDVVDTEESVDYLSLGSVSPSVRKTIEETDSSLEITFGSGKTDFTGLRENINNSSFEKVIKSMSFTEMQEFYLDLMSISNSNNLDSSSNKYNYTPFNIKELIRGFKNAGYKADGFFGGIEMGSLMQLVVNIYKTQEKFNSGVDFRDKLAVLFDHNQDGIIDNDGRFLTREEQFLDAVVDENQFENLLKNLGYSSLSEYNNSFNNNYYAARAEFKTRLGILLSGEKRINPGEMLINPNAVADFNKYLESIDNANMTVSDIVDTHEITKNLPEDVKNQIKLQAMGAVVGSSYGFGVTYDVKELTNNIIDSAGYGIFNGVPGIGIGKNIIKTENGGFRVDIGIVNFIPFISATGVISDGELKKFEELFPNKLDSSSKISLGAGVSTLGSTIGFDISSVNENTRTGIEKAKNKMSELLDSVFEDIKSGKSFEESNFSGNESDKLVYERLFGMFKANGGYEKYLKEGALNNYERELYQNADGSQFTGAGLGLSFVAGYLPIPIIFAHGEKHSTTWKQVETYSSKLSGRETISETKGGYLDSSIEGNDDILSNLSNFESAFSWKTRYNKGSKDFLTTDNNLETRWNGLLQLSKGVKALRDVNLNKFLNSVKDDGDKWLVISTISQYMRKANDYDNGNIDSWNTKTNEFIAIDKKRRSSFDKMFGFSLEKEAEQYYTLLGSSKGKIGKTEIIGVGFDATSSKNVEGTTTKGIDTLYTNLSILTVDEKPLLIPINDPLKIEAFKNTISKLTTISPEVKQNLISGIENGSIELNFYKDPEGFDDRIIPITKKEIIRTPGVSAPLIDVFQPEFNTVDFGIGFIGEQKLENPSRDQTTTPGVEPGQSSTPGVENETSNPVTGGGSPDSQTGGR